MLEYFTDPILRAPTIGCMLMCFSAALVGVVAFLRKQSLLGESLSHAAYPGVIIGVVLSGALSLVEGGLFGMGTAVMAGGFITALVGLWVIHFLETKVNIRPDSALCFTLSAFFGVGLTIASRVQFTHSALYKKSLTYLYGQAATMTDIHILIYGSLSLVIVATVFLFYKELKTITFDRDFAKSLGIQVNLIDTIIFLLIVLAVVVGIRSVGVVLMSAMLIAPAAAARAYTNRFWVMLVIASFVGLASGFLGNYLSVEWNGYLLTLFPSERLALPTGPMIVLVASFICVFSLLFAPQRGVITRLLRISRFRFQCMSENLLKAIWRIAPTEMVSFDQIASYQSASKFYLRFVLRRLEKNGWIESYEGSLFRLTYEGAGRATRIVRLHRLWEVYLADYLGVGSERVHRSAEEMEHILTPEIEEELTHLLRDPKKDPHQQPIPPKFEEL